MKLEEDASKILRNGVTPIRASKDIVFFHKIYEEAYGAGGKGMVVWYVLTEDMYMEELINEIESSEYYKEMMKEND